jgi:hypothetical protein
LGGRAAAGSSARIAGAEIFADLTNRQLSPNLPPLRDSEAVRSDLAVDHEHVFDSREAVKGDAVPPIPRTMPFLMVMYGW